MGTMYYGITVISKKNKPLMKSKEDFKKKYDAIIEEEDGKTIVNYQWNEWEAPSWNLGVEIDHKNHMFIKHGRNGKEDVKIPFRDESGEWIDVYAFTGKRNVEFITTKANLSWILKGLILENIKEIALAEWYD